MKTNAPLASASYIATTDDLVAQKKSNLLFNRVINVKFIRKKMVKGVDSFTIRSDYEPVYNNDKEGTISFVPCSVKPSMVLEYFQVADSTSVTIRLEVDAFYVDRMLVGDDLDSAGASGNPVVAMKIQLGYIDDFPRWDKAVASPGARGLTDMQRFYDLDPMEAAGKELMVQVLDGYRTGVPPDSKWVFNGTVANMSAGYRWSFKTDSFDKTNYNYADFPKNLSAVEAMLFQFITRRFVRSSVDNKTTEKPVKNDDGTYSLQKTVSVRDIEYYRTGNTEKRDGKLTELVTTEEGILSTQDAIDFGVRCICSEKLRRTAPKDMINTGVHGDAVATETPEAGYNMFNDQKTELFPQILAIQSQYSFIRFFQMSDGNLFFYRADESFDDISDDPYVADLQESRPVKLSAVYDITVGGMRTIRCPFMGILDPMTTVIFQSRYRIAESVAGFFTQPGREMYAFLVQLCNVEFATVEDRNMMVLHCTDIGESSMPEIDFSGNVFIPRRKVKRVAQSYSGGAEEKAKAARLSWQDISYTVGAYPLNRGDMGWMDLARGLVECANPDNWDGGAPTIVDALDGLKEWNSTGVWTVAREKNANDKYSPENKLVTGLSYKIPWLLPGDKVILRHPFMKEYDPAYKVGT